MPVTVSYDLSKVSPDDRNYLRSMLERFAWRRLGGSVFRYSGRQRNGDLYEDWLNDVVPALMFFRSFIQERKLKLSHFTVDASSVSFLDLSDPKAPLGKNVLSGSKLRFRKPTNPRSARKTIRQFVNAAASATG